MGLHNPYLDEYLLLEDNFISQCIKRYELLCKYSYAIPNEEAIEYISSLSPIVEMGAGNGYWTYLLRQLGTNVIAYDKAPYNNEFIYNSKWSDVKVGTPSILTKHSNRTLFLCWPYSDDLMAIECLKYYKGNNLIYVGEMEGGCCAEDEFFEELYTSWKVIHEVSIPRYEGIHDYLIHARRKTQEDYIYHKEW